MAEEVHNDIRCWLQMLLFPASVNWKNSPSIHCCNSTTRRSSPTVSIIILVFVVVVVNNCWVPKRPNRTKGGSSVRPFDHGSHTSTAYRGQQSDRSLHKSNSSPRYTTWLRSYIFSSPARYYTLIDNWWLLQAVAKPVDNDNNNINDLISTKQWAFNYLSIICQ